MKKILCIGDSLALPGHLNTYEDTWFFKLKKAFPNYDFLSFFKRQLTTEVLVTMGGGQDGIDKWPKGADCLESFMPDIIILQLGIVDCAPRLLNKYERKLVRLLPKSLRRIFINILKVVKKRSLHNTIVPYQLFKENLANYMARAENLVKGIIIIPISIPDDSFLTRNKEAIINIEKYNNYYFELGRQSNKIHCTRILDSINFSDPIYQDGYHPNEIGHNEIFYQIKKKLVDLN